MAIKYFCDHCGDEVKPTSHIAPSEIATIEFIDPATGKSDQKMACTKCTKELKQYIQQKQKDNKVISVGDNFNLKIK